MLVCERCQTKLETILDDLAGDYHYCPRCEMIDLGIETQQEIIKDDSKNQIGLAVEQ
jgi:hypothetical protein